MIGFLKGKNLWVLCAALIALAGWFFWPGGDTNAIKKSATLVRTATTQRQDVPRLIDAVGTVSASHSVAVRSRLDSQITRVAFADGEEVTEGQLLFTLDDRALSAQLAQAEAAHDRDQAQLSYAKAQYARARELAGKEFTSRSDLDNARAAFEAAEANVQASKATAEQLRVQRSYTQIVAPISGRTGTVSVRAGNTVKANDTAPLVVINRIKPVRVQMALPQRELAAVRSAMASGAVDVTARGDGGATARGTLEHIDNAVDAATGAFSAHALFTNDDEALWPGMFVNLSLRLGSDSQVLTVPEVAIQRSPDGDFVFLVKDAKARKQPVKVARTSRGLAVIEEGIRDGDSVIVDGMMSLTDGSDITLSSSAGKP